MIEGTNVSSLVFPIEEIEAYGKDLSDISTTGDVLANLHKRRENVLNGGTNCIPLPFVRFRSEVPGIEQGQYVVVTANQKTGKTQLANFLYLFHALDYAYNNPTKCSVHIIYFALEESVQKIIERYMSYLLYKLNNIRISPADLRSTSAEYVIPESILQLFDEPEYRKRLDFFEKHVQFETEDTNPTGILRVCEKYAKSVGQYNSHTIKSNGQSGKEVQVFDSYIPNDPNHYKILVIDHIGLVDKEQGFRTKDAVDKMSEYCVKYLRNRYGFTCVAIQQQASDSEGLEAIKAKRMVPTAAGLGDSKYTARDADLVVGLFDPSKFGQARWLGYCIQDDQGNGLKTYARFLYVLANRNGEMGGICPLFFDGAACNFEELPRPDDVPEVKKYYDLANKLKSYRQQMKFKQLTSAVLTFFIKKFRHQ